MRRWWPGTTFGPVGFDARNKFDKGKVQVVADLHVPFALIDHLVYITSGFGQRPQLDAIGLMIGVAVEVVIGKEVCRNENRNNRKRRKAKEAIKILVH